MELLYISAGAECWSKYMCLLLHIKTAPHSHPLFNSVPDSAASHRHIANQNHAITVGIAVIVTHSHKVLQTN